MDSNACLRIHHDQCVTNKCDPTIDHPELWGQFSKLSPSHHPRVPVYPLVNVYRAIEAMAIEIVDVYTYI